MLSAVPAKTVDTRCTATSFYGCYNPCSDNRNKH